METDVSSSPTANRSAENKPRNKLSSVGWNDSLLRNPFVPTGMESKVVVRAQEVNTKNDRRMRAASPIRWRSAKQTAKEQPERNKPPRLRAVAVGPAGGVALIGEHYVGRGDSSIFGVVQAIASDSVTVTGRNGPKSVSFDKGKTP
ncbi:MAG: hypothetical protein GF344_08060 [Chitinivibrionales bacterium]|nr:hypothetical protein [Chitinivibrionales bacterium]MBD3356844.1 hypothetical protein [Chitinivibrionales bacterium]